MMDASGLLNSCAMPAARPPDGEHLSDWTSTSSMRTLSVHVVDADDRALHAVADEGIDGHVLEERVAVHDFCAVSLEKGFLSAMD
jgi:hypothetical protein